MTATSHPDATAFAARFLATPNDRLGRLVFADWLDEQGGESNAAWAQYLRLMARAEVESDSDCLRDAEIVGRTVRARLTLSAVPGKSLLPLLTAFLPTHRVWVRIGEVQIWLAAWEVCPESVARRHGVMPIAASDRRVHFVTAMPVNELDQTRDALSFVLNQEVVFFRGFSEDVYRALSNHYGWPEAQYMLELPDPSALGID